MFKGKFPVMVLNKDQYINRCWFFYEVLYEIYEYLSQVLEILSLIGVQQSKSKDVLFCTHIKIIKFRILAERNIKPISVNKEKLNAPKI